MATAKATHLAAEFGLCQVILKKLEYLLVATTFSLQHCNDIMHPILATGLPAAGYVYSFPHRCSIIHRPWQWGGLIF